MPGPHSIVFVRHAERLTIGTDPGLSTAGKKRAQLLAFMLENSRITSIFISPFRRTKETAQPLAQRLSLIPKVLEGPNVTAERDRILAETGAALVVGHTNTIPELLTALGVVQHVQIAETEFNRMWIVSRNGNPSGLFSMRYPP
jgi:phosphohistidine phosphatase SixA